MKKEFEYGKIVAVVIVFVVVIVLISIMFYVNLKKMAAITVEATVTYVGDCYIVVRDDNKDEYSLQTELEYNVGDRVSFTMKNIDENSYPKEGTVERLDIISKTVQFSISDSNVDNEIKIETESTNEVSNNESVDLKTSVDEEVGEIAVVSYFRDLNNKLNDYSQDNSLGQSIKSGFVTVVDFLFYDGTIKGMTFNELSTTAKIEVLKLVFSIDQKVEEYFPGYKEDISLAGSKIYTNVKSKAIELYLDVTTKVCEDNPDACVAAKEGLSELKSSFSLTWNYIKDISGAGISKLRAWYEIWREA